MATPAGTDAPVEITPTRLRGRQPANLTHMTPFLQDHVPLEPRLVMHNTQEQAISANLALFAQQARERAGAADAAADTTSSMPRPTLGGGVRTPSDSDDTTVEDETAPTDEDSAEDEAAQPGTQSPGDPDDSDGSDDDDSDDDNEAAGTQERDACPICSVTFRSSHAMMLHIRSAHASLSAATWATHTQWLSDNRCTLCANCNKPYTTQYVQRHQRACTNAPNSAHTPRTPVAAAVTGVVARTASVAPLPAAAAAATPDTRSYALWITPSIETFFETLDEGEFSACKCRTLRYLHKTCVEQFKHIHDTVLAHWLATTDRTCLRVYAALPRMLLRATEGSGATAAKAVRERCAQFWAGDVEALWELPDTPPSAPPAPTDASTIKTATFLTRQGELSKATSRMTGSALKSIAPDSADEAQLRSNEVPLSPAGCLHSTYKTVRKWSSRISGRGGW